MRLLWLAIWAYLLSWLGTALIHVVDSDVGSIQGLGDPSVLLSVSIAALIMLGPVLICSAAYVRGRWRSFARTVAVCAVGMGVLAVAFGFGGRSIANGILAVVGMSAMFGLMLVIAALPAIWIERAWSKKATART